MKRRKKNNTKQKKQDIQTRRNEFYRKLKQVITLFGDASALKLLDKIEYNFLYHCRIRPYKIINPPNSQQILHRKEIDLLNKILNHLLHEAVIEIDNPQIKISEYDFLVYVETLYLYCRNLPKTNKEIAAKFLEYVPIVNSQFQEIRIKALEQIRIKLEILALLNSDLKNKIIYFKPKQIEKTKLFDTSCFYNTFIIEAIKVKTELLEIDGHKRTIYLLYTHNTKGFIPLSIAAYKFGIEGPMQKLPIMVYIQQHAIDRIKTRLGNQFHFQRYILVLSAMLEDPIPTGNNKCYLFAVKHDRIKLGYLKADIIGDKLLIRSFLFLTNNGTPEGKKLGKLIGLQKEDKKYLGIDHLSTFIFSDIKQNEKLKALFYQAGCGDLFQLDKKILNEPDKKEIVCAQFVSHYLGI